MHPTRGKVGNIEQRLERELQLLSDVGHLTKVTRCEIDQYAWEKNDSTDSFWTEKFIPLA